MPPMFFTEFIATLAVTATASSLSVHSIIAWAWAVRTASISIYVWNVAKASKLTITAAASPLELQELWNPGRYHKDTLTSVSPKPEYKKGSFVAYGTAESSANTAMTLSTLKIYFYMNRTHNNDI